MSVAGHFDCRIIALQKLQQQPYLLDKMLIMYHEHIIVAAQRKKTENCLLTQTTIGFKHQI